MARVERWTNGGSRTWLVAMAATLFLLFQPIAAAGQSTEPAATETVAQVDTGELAESSAPAAVTESPAEVVTVVPTEVVAAEPTVAATATETATAEPIETAIPATETATTGATEPGTPTATATATASSKQNTKTSTSQMAAAAVSSPVCSLYSDSNVVTIDRYVTYYCESDKKPIKITVTAISANWEWAYSFGSLVNPSGWTSTTNASTEASGGISSVYVYLRPLAAVPPGSTATATVSIDRPNGTTTSVISLAAVRALQTSNFQTTCSPESITVATSASGSVTCTISGNDIASGATVGVSNLMIAAPAGWTVSPSVMSGSVTANAPFSVVLTLRPACGAPVNPTLPNVTVNATLTFQSGAPFAAPAGAFKAAHGATSTVTALITSSNLDWSKPYSFASQSVSGSMTYQVQASGCAGWNVQISSTPFAYTGSAGGAAIPGSNIQVVPGSVTAMSGSTSNVTPGSAGSLGGPIKMLSASETWGVGTYLQTLGLSVTIPGGARVGTYTATISLTAASGP